MALALQRASTEIDWIPPRGWLVGEPEFGSGPAYAALPFAASRAACSLRAAWMSGATRAATSGVIGGMVAAARSLAAARMRSLSLSVTSATPVLAGPRQPRGHQITRSIWIATFR